MNKLGALKRKCDRLLQLKHVPLNPKCLLCDNPTSEMHHFCPKSQSNYLRYDPRNLINLCRRCHARHHLSGDPSIVAEIIRIKGMDWYDGIKQDRHKIKKLNVGTMKEILEQLS